MADEYLIPVSITHTRSSFLVVKLRANSRAEAERRAVEGVRTGLRDYTIDVPSDCFDSDDGTYETNGTDQVDKIEDYTVDLDISAEKTDAERDAEKRQQTIF